MENYLETRAKKLFERNKGCKKEKVFAERLKVFVKEKPKKEKPKK